MTAFPDLSHLSSARWFTGCTVYQIFVDRFARGTNSHAEPHHRPWSELPAKSEPDEQGSYPHCHTFWGGNLVGIIEKLDYIASLGVDAIYLTPIFQAPSNHKYDTGDYLQIDPSFGTEQDFDALIAACKTRNLRLVLDGVFNHVGTTYPAFVSALKGGPERSWFQWDDSRPCGYRGFMGIRSMPMLNWECTAVRDCVRSVVQHYLRKGIDGWRLDVAFDIGPAFLAEIVDAAKQVNPDALVQAEVLGYPSTWHRTSAVDGVYDFHWLKVVQAVLDGNLSSASAIRMLATSFSDAGTKRSLQNWMHLDNHDCDRFASLEPSPKRKRFLQSLWATLPGSPLLYYGTELGMKGKGDPANRAPMRWDLVRDDNVDLAHIRHLLQLRKDSRALRIGAFVPLEADRCIAFARVTTRILESRLVVANHTKKSQRCLVSTRLGMLFSGGRLVDSLSRRVVHVNEGLVEVKLAPYEVAIFAPEAVLGNGYSPYERIP